MTTLGVLSLMAQPLEGFLCSRKISSAALLRCYDWATAMAGAGKVVMGGFSSAVERDVLELLLRCKVPVVVVLARQHYKTLPPAWQEAVDEGRMLIVSLSDAQRQSAQTAAARNSYIIQHAHHLTVGCLDPNGSLAQLLSGYDRSYVRLDMG